MKLKILVSMAGVVFTLNAGQTIDADIDEARRLVDAGFAEALEPFPEIPVDEANDSLPANIETTDNQTVTETAVAEPVAETAVPETSAVETR